MTFYKKILKGLLKNTLLHLHANIKDAQGDCDIQCTIVTLKHFEIHGIATLYIHAATQPQQSESAGLNHNPIHAECIILKEAVSTVTYIGIHRDSQEC